jgi:hypothetical protein
MHQEVTVSEWRRTQRARIEQPLQKLLETPGRPFVVITDPKTGKFVQYIGSRSEPLLLDLPSSQLLSDKEVRAAERLLGQPRFVKMGSRTDKRVMVWHAGPFDKPRAAADRALDVMEEVFEAAGRDLRVEFSR